MTKVNIPTPRVFAPVFQSDWRYLGIHGGRAGGKSHFVAEYIIEECLMRPGLRVLCGREIQKSLNQSVKRLLEDKIKKLGVESQFEILQSEIRTPGGGIILFAGLQSHTSDSVKSFERIDICWLEESQTISQRSLDILLPTIVRVKGYKIIATWNPSFATDPVDKLLRCNDEESKTRGAKPPPNSLVIEANYKDNPFLNDEIHEIIQYDLNRDPEKHAHVWLGHYQQNSEARVFRNWKVEEFETPEDARLLFGADWGFRDPTCLIRGFIGRFEDDEPIADPDGNCLFFDYEAYKIECTIESTPALFDEVPGSRDWPIRADSARPETIDYMQRNGFPRMVRSTKGKNSIIEGVEFLKNYDIYIHPRCKHTIDEFTLYSYKVDPKTEEILPVLEDDHCHIIDSARYMLELVRRAEKFSSGTGFGPRVFRG